MPVSSLRLAFIIALLVASLWRSAAAADDSIFRIDGLGIGSFVRVDSKAYSEFHCAPSYYEAFTWCTRVKRTRTTMGEATFGSLIAHRASGEIVFISQSSAPAYFSIESIESEIRRLSARIGAAPKLITIQEPPSDVAGAIIAVWGDIELVPISASERDYIAASQDINAGYLIDFLNDFKRSVAAGQPIFRCTGRRGYLWAAEYDQRERAFCATERSIRRRSSPRLSGSACCSAEWPRTSTGAYEKPSNWFRARLPPKRN